MLRNLHCSPSILTVITSKVMAQLWLMARTRETLNIYRMFGETIHGTDGLEFVVHLTSSH
jgi:hypothetical protein